MKPESQRPKGREGATGALNAAIKDTDLAGKASRIAPARIAFGSTSTLLTLIRVSMSPVLPPRSAPSSHIARIQRQMDRIVSSLGYSVSTSAERLTKGRMERDRTSSVSPCTMRLISYRCELNQRDVSRTVDYLAFDCRTVADIQKKLVKWGERNAVSRRFHARKDKETIAAWRSSLEKILQILNVRSVALVMTVADFPFPEGTCNRHRRSRFYCPS